MPATTQRTTALNGLVISPGLLHAFRIEEDGLLTPLQQIEVDADLCKQKALWAHFNLSNARSIEWFARCTALPPAAREFFAAAEDRVEIQRAGNALMGVLSDLQYSFDFDPEEVVTLRFYLDPYRLITARHHPVSSIDRLRTQARSDVRFASPIALFARLIELQTATLEEIADRLSAKVDRAEDHILAQRRTDARGDLGAVRRLAVRLYRYLLPEHKALASMAKQLPDWAPPEVADALAEDTIDFRNALQDLMAIQERSKLLQEEIAARMAEETNRNLYVLSVVTAVFLPMTLITGIFGMNVADLPGTQEHGAFFWVMVLMFAVGLLAVVVLTRKRLL